MMKRLCNSQQHRFPRQRIHHVHRHRRVLQWLMLTLPLAVLLVLPATPNTYADVTTLQWVHLSTKGGALPSPAGSEQQTAAMIVDIDGDGLNDFVIAGRRASPAVVWYRRGEEGWQRYLVEEKALHIEAGGAYHDIDGDGDPDLVLGGDNRSNEIWWWENPAPTFAPETPWTRHQIKASGENKHHDQLFGDFDDDGQIELAFWNQGAQALFLAEIPAEPRQDEPWPLRKIYQWSDGEEHEGLAQADINGDGVSDLVGGGRWFERTTDGTYQAHVIDDSQRFSRVAAGQLIPGGPPEVVLGCGDCDGPLQWYSLVDGAWISHPLLERDIRHGHTLALADFDGDGALDIFAAEMRLNGNNANATMWVLLGNNQGTFTPTVVASGYGNHESKVGDLNGDGTPDILGKPYNWETPRLDIWLNQQRCGLLDQWQRHVLDDARPWRALFVRWGDLDGDGLDDLAVGAYRA
ncbi:MAG TPA: VCBS repeat-containing protein, partial [Caldilineaceae bacterium]|nr:VCBS repeat-containing protein [Caldilineaceae bacterium]